MKRLATRIATAAWMGFLGVFAAELAVDVAAPELLMGSTAFDWPLALKSHVDGIAPVLDLLAPSLKPGLAVLCLALAGVSACALHALNASRAGRPERAEQLLGGVLAGVALLAIAARLTGQPLLPVDPAGGLVWIALAASTLALLFDRLVDTSAVGDEADFEAGIAAIAGSLARQTRLYTPTHTRHGDGPR